MAGNRRLKKELDSLQSDPLDGCMVGPVNDDIFHWQVMMDGPAGTPYEGGLFEIDVTFPAEYPFKAPKVAPHRTIAHPRGTEYVLLLTTPPTDRRRALFCKLSHHACVC